MMAPAKAEIRAVIRELAEEHDLEIPSGILVASGEPAERERQFQAGLEEFQAALPDGVELSVTGRNASPAGDESEADDEPLTRSEVINAFGHELGRRLIDAGFASGQSIREADDEELLGIPDVGPATLERIRLIYPAAEDE